MREFFKALLTPVRPTDAQIWDCEPLVIEHTEDGIVYAQNTKVEFTPNSGDLRLGRAVALTPVQGWNPHLIATQRIDTLQNATPVLRVRVGLTLVGVDDRDVEYLWHIGAAADQVLIDWARPERFAPDLPLLTPEGLAALNDDAATADEDEVQTWLCQPLIVVDAFGEIVARGEVPVNYTPVESKLRRAYLRAKFTTEEGWRPSLHAVTSKQDALSRYTGAPNWTFTGYDENGDPYTWLIGRPALHALDARQEGSTSNEPE